VIKFAPFFVLAILLYLHQRKQFNLNPKKMMKKLLLLAFLSVCGLFCATASAQNLEDIVYLKDGSIIRGIILEQIPGESLKIGTRDGNIFVYSMDDVERITRERVSRNSRGEIRENKFNNPRGYLGILELGNGLGFGDWAATRVSITMINGYRVSPYFAVGVGIGFESFAYRISPTDIHNETTVPVFLHLRSDLINGRVSPFLAFNVGYAINVSDDYFFEGVMLEPMAGVSFNVGHRHRMTASLGIAMNGIKYYEYGSVNKQTAMGNALNIKIGYSF
jgi:hypothetical protein